MPRFFSAKATNKKLAPPHVSQRSWRTEAVVLVRQSNFEKSAFIKLLAGTITVYKRYCMHSWHTHYAHIFTV
jgi:hypothetical protein